MKIVVVTGSPRKFGNSFSMTEAFIKEAEHRQTVRCRIYENRWLSCLDDLLQDRQCLFVR